MTREQEDDDDLGIDLDAWQPPPVPGGIADAVVAQMRQEHTSITTVTAIDSERRTGKRIWLVAVPLVAAAAAGIVAFGIRRAPANGQGTVVAERPMHLELGPSSAELDRDTQVTWKRDRHRITATQTNGAATWRVDEDDTLTIDAALASIEAKNASLRVEVKMLEKIDPEQKRTIATSAVTAAAVALVTIVVYEGALKVREADGKTTQVAAGTTYQIKGPTVIEDEASTVGAGTPELVAQVEDLNRQIAQKRKELDELESKTVEKTDEIEEPQDFDFSAGTTPQGLDRKEIKRVMQKIAPKLRDCAANVAFDGKINVTVSVSPDGNVENVTLDPEDAKPAECISDAIKTAKFTKTKSVTMFKYPLVFQNMSPKAACDFAELYARGQESFATNNWTGALAGFEGAYQCRNDTQALKLTVASACRAKNLTKAREYWAKMNQNMRDQVLGICIGAGITPDKMNPTIVAPKETGMLDVKSPKDAEVFVDGRRIGQGLVEITLSPGKHKVTLQIGDNRHSFAVNIKAGETVMLDKRNLE